MSEPGGHMSRFTVWDAAFVICAVMTIGSCVAWMVTQNLWWVVPTLIGAMFLRPIAWAPRDRANGR